MSDPAASRQTVEILPEHNKASITIVRDSISAIDEQLHYTHIDKVFLLSFQSYVLIYEECSIIPMNAKF